MTRKRIFISLTVSIVIIASLLLALPHYLRLDTYKNSILAELQQQLKRRVDYETSTIRLGWGAVFTFNRITVSEREQAKRFLAASRLQVTVEIIPLLRGKVVLRNLVIEQPEATIIRYPDGRFNLSDLLESQPGQPGMHLHRLVLENAGITIIDQAIAATPFTTRLQDTHLALHGLSRGKKGSIRLTTTIADSATPGEIAITGKYTLPPPASPLTATKLDLQLTGKRLNAAHAWPYYQRHAPFKQLIGLLDLDTSIAGQLAEFTAKGKFGVSGLVLDYRPIFHAVLRPRELRCAYNIQVTPAIVDIKTLDLTVDGLRVKGKCAIRDLDKKDPRITASAMTTPIDLQKFNAYIPYGIITKDVADYIEQRVKGGILHLDEGKLDGTISQILNMGVGTNYNVLAISTHIEDGIVSYGPKAPAFTAISGRLELKGKDFILSGMSGKFGDSPFTMQGRITDYPPTPAPCTFPFTMQITPRPTEVAWLLGPERGHRLSYSGDTPLQLTGEGPTSSYTLSGSWQLGKAYFAVGDLIQKPGGKNCSLAFKSTITPQSLTIQSASIGLGPLLASLAGSWQFAAPGSGFQLTLGTNRFASHEVSPLLPRLRPFQAEGLVQANLSGTGRGLDLTTASWRGQLQLTDFGLKPGQRLKPLRGMTGTLQLQGNSLTTPQLAVQVGATPLSGRGTVQWGDLPSWSASFSSHRVTPADFGLVAPPNTTPPIISNVQGTLSYGKDLLAIKSLVGQINRTPLTLRGFVQTGAAPGATLTVSSTAMNINDVIALVQLESPSPPGSAPAKPWHLVADVTADSGTISNLAFSRLRAQTELKDSILYLRSFDLQAYGGKVSGNSRLDFGGTPPRYQLAGTANALNAGQLLAALGVKEQKLTGTIDLSTDLTCKGNTAEECKKTILGSATIEVTEGSINRFPILSKVFSILNVSQLLKFQLPDMVSGGMPFNELSGTFAIADGVISSSNLFMASDAINLSAVGSLNLPRNEINATIGVQPLQTIDKVVSKIPVVGWILTGKDKTLITTDFEAHGPPADPRVAAIPVKSMAKGTLDIFKRIFTLPAKLITDTGEVLLNK